MTNKTERVVEMGKSEIDQVLIVLNVSPALEDVLVDWLLAREDGVGFTTVPASGHSSAHHDFTSTEQVKGRKRQVQFQIQLLFAEVASFLVKLRSQFPGADLRYWVLPIITCGHLADGQG